MGQHRNGRHRLVGVARSDSGVGVQAMNIDIGWVPLILVIFVTVGWSVIVFAIGKPYWKKWFERDNK